RSAFSLRTWRSRRNTRIACGDSTDLPVGRAAVCVQVGRALRPLATAGGGPLPGAASRPVEAAVRGAAEHSARVPRRGRTAAAGAESVLAGVAAETDVAAGAAVTRIGLRVDADAVADERLVEILQDADVVHTLVTRVTGRLARKPGALLARRAHVAAPTAVVRVVEHVDADAVAQPLAAVLALASAREADLPRGALVAAGAAVRRVAVEVGTHTGAIGVAARTRAGAVLARLAARAGVPAGAAVGGVLQEIRTRAAVAAGLGSGFAAVAPARDIAFRGIAAPTRVVADPGPVPTRPARATAPMVAPWRPTALRLRDGTAEKRPHREHDRKQ